MTTALFSHLSALAAVATTLVRAWTGQCVLGEPVGVVTPPPFATFPVTVSVAGHDEEADWLARSFDTARALFAPFGVAFGRTPEIATLPERFAHT